MINFENACFVDLLDFFVFLEELVEVVVAVSDEELVALLLL